MHSAARKVLSRQIRNIKCQRKYSLSAAPDRKEDFIIKSPLKDIVISETRFLDRLWKYGRFEKFVALECAETRKSYTYGQLQEYMGSFATSLHKRLGLKLDDVVATVLPNSPEFPVVAFGTLQGGCILTTINPIYKEAEISHQVSLTQPKVIVTIPECYDNIVKGLSLAKLNAKIVVIDQPSQAIPNGTIRYSEIVEKGEADFGLLDKIERKHSDIAVIPFSSGTTGLPKGVVITYRNLLAALEMMDDEKVCYPKLTTESFQDVVPCLLPFFHIYGMVVALMGHLVQGCKLVTMTKFSTNVYLDVLKNDKATLLYVVPPIAILLSKHPDVGYEHLRHVRRICSGAAPLTASDVEPILKKSKGNIEIGQGYGATETTSLVTSSFIGFEADYSATGQPMGSMELMFVDTQTGKPVPYGEQGEMYVRGPSIMKGYYKNEKATKETLTEDGFFKTGDLGYYKMGTGLYITDRIKELIKVKGMQVAPAELESLLRSHPAVSDAAVVGIPHEIYGETPKAFIITKANSKTSSDDIQQFVASKVAPYKKIENIQFVDSIPKTTSGKILRKDLLKMYA